MVNNKQTRERQLFFTADALGTYVFVVGLVLSALASLLSAVLEASPEQAAGSMAAAWVCALGVSRVFVTIKADRIEEQ